jgi:hypothetical protein
MRDRELLTFASCAVAARFAYLRRGSMIPKAGWTAIREGRSWETDWAVPVALAAICASHPFSSP